MANDASTDCELPDHHEDAVCRLRHGPARQRQGPHQKGVAALIASFGKQVGVSCRTRLLLSP
jgi:hypothetical protein